MDVLNVELLWPPSVNHYYIHSARGVSLGVRGKSYRRDTALLLRKHRGACGDKRLEVVIKLYPPDKRKRDIDNVLKCILDSLQYATIYDDDNQIDVLTVMRMHQVKDGLVKVWITECLSSG